MIGRRMHRINLRKNAIGGNGLSVMFGIKIKENHRITMRTILMNAPGEPEVLTVSPTFPYQP